MKQEDLLEIVRKGGSRGLTQLQRATFAGLGLTKNGRKVLIVDTDATRGMVNQVIHWVEVRQVPAAQSAAAREALVAAKKRKSGYRVVGQSK